MESEFSENGIVNGRNVNNYYSVPDSLHLGVEFIYIFMSTAIFNNTFSSNNKGSLSVIKSSIKFLSNTTFVDNHPRMGTVKPVVPLLPIEVVYLSMEVSF